MAQQFLRDCQGEKAEEFLCDARTITTTPVDGKARMVKSKSKPYQPHLVQVLSGGKVGCDENHPMWTSLKICRHCVAVWAALVSMLLGLLSTLGSLTSQTQPPSKSHVVQVLPYNQSQATCNSSVSAHFTLATLPLRLPPLPAQVHLPLLFNHRLLVPSQFCWNSHPSSWN